MVEQARGSAYTEILYGPGGGKVALMNGQTLSKAFVPLPGGPVAVYNASGFAYYRHADWLGSSRVSTTGSRGLNYDAAYSPFGEDFAQKTGSGGTADLSFTAQNQDTEAGGGSNGQYDFLFRQYSAVQGRWISPDPAGLAAVDPSNPQSWNRYGYVDNNPLSAVDPLGLCGGTWTLWTTSADGTLNVISDVPCGDWWTLVLQGLPLNVFCGITGSCSPNPPSSSGGGSLYLAGGVAVPTTFMDSGHLSFTVTPQVGGSFSPGAGIGAFQEGSFSVKVLQQFANISNSDKTITILDPPPAITSVSAVLNNSNSPCIPNENCQLIINGSGLVYSTQYVIIETGTGLVVASAPAMPIPWTTVTTSAFSVTKAGIYTIQLTNVNQANGLPATVTSVVRQAD